MCKYIHKKCKCVYITPIEVGIYICTMPIFTYAQCLYFTYHHTHTFTCPLIHTIVYLRVPAYSHKVKYTLASNCTFSLRTIRSQILNTHKYKLRATNLRVKHQRMCCKLLSRCARTNCTATQNMGLTSSWILVELQLYNYTCIYTELHVDTLSFYNIHV